MPRTSTRSTARLPRGSQSQQLGIQSFARATKPGLSTSSGLSKDGKKDQDLSSELAPVSTAPHGILPVSPSKKRKLNEIENVECGVRDQGVGGKSDVEGFLTPSKSLKFSALAVSTPRSGHYASSSSSSASKRRASQPEPETDDNVPSTPSKRATAKTPKSSRRESFVLATTRPACVEELVKLHSAFLKALTIHTAHNGIAAPVDLREFLPSVERIWKKRKVVVKDLQRLLWVLMKGCDGSAASGGLFRLANHGLGRVCLERVTGRTVRIDEVELQAQFEEAVDLLWEGALDAAGGDESRVDFMATLGLASIQESLAPFTAFRKGQQRLQDLRGGVIKLKMEVLLSESTADETSTSPSPSKIRDATTSRRQGLLDRIKNKEMHQAKLPPPPSKGVLLRCAAAGRVEEVAGVLALLRPVGYVGSGPTARMAVQRTPFCLETIVRNVQDSTHNPISAKEVESCLDILSRGDVAGHWVSIVVVNQLKSVVLKSSGDVLLKEIGAKVSQLKMAWDGSTSL
ncbi:hypothetical protein BDW59DRAFT_144477 [Aspergillus cavernicola]|uniref:DNA replication factor Cdt1 C-terminal domain-containing protein n=1 Tax=Aspergillus cavernicola TaxID=176166 RepID=A0ABR4IGU8_9EURO